MAAHNLSDVRNTSEMQVLSKVCAEDSPGFE